MAGGMVTNGITISFKADLSSLADGVKSISSMFSELTSSAKALSSSFSDAFSGLSNIAMPDLSDIGIGEVAEELTELASNATGAVESLTSVGTESEEAGQESLSFRDSLNQISSSLQDLGSNIGGVVSGRLNSFASSVQQAASGPINNFINGIRNLASNINEAASGPINSFVSRVQDLSSTVSDMASSAFDSFISRVQDLGSSINDAVSGPLNAFSDGVQNIASIISDTASSAFNNLASGVQQIGSNISDVVSGPLNSFVSGIQQIGSNINDAVSGPLNSFTSGVQQVATNIGNAVSGPFNSFISSIQSFGADISEAATGPLADLISGIKSLSSAVGDAASGPLNSFKDSVQNTTSGLGGMFQQVFSGSSGMEGLQNAFSGAVSGVQDFIGGIGDAVGGVMDFAGSVMQGAQQLQMFAQQAESTAQALLGPAMSAETMQTSFDTLLGSTQAANAEMQKLDAFASKTPFKTMDIDQAASQLIGFGTSAQDVIPDLTSIGDAISAVGKGSTANLDSIVNIFGKIQLSGKLTGADMNQFSADGINAWKVLEQQTGKTQSQLQSMISSGLLPAGTAIKDLTQGIEQNPLYAGGMAKQSATMSGLLSTLKSNWDQMLASFGSPILKDLEPLVGNIGTALSSQGFKDFGGTVGKNVADAFKSIGDFVTKNNIGGEIVALGQNLSNFFNNPNMKEFVKTVGQDLVNGFASLMKAVSSPAFGTFMKDVGTFVGGSLLGLWNGIKNVGEAVLNTAKFFKDHKVAMDALEAVLISTGLIISAIVIPAFVAWAISMVPVVIGALAIAAPFIVVGLIIAAVILGIILVIQNWGAIVKWLTGVWSAVATFFGWLWGVIAGFFVGVGKWFADRFTEAYHGILGAIGGIGAWFQGIWKDIQGAFGAVGNWFHNLWQGVCDDFTSVLGGLGKLAGTIWNGVTGAIKSGFNWVIDLINGVIKNIDNIKVAGFGVSIPLIPHLASGISNFMGGIALVGEQGPELVGLPKGSSVFNASNTSNFLKDIGNFKSSAISGAIASPSAVNYAAMAGGASQAPIIVNVHPTVTSPDMYVDGKKVTNEIAKHLAHGIRLQGGVRRQ